LDHSYLISLLISFNKDSPELTYLKVTAFDLASPKMALVKILAAKDWWDLSSKVLKSQKLA
jgi:hypothetical protein